MIFTISGQSGSGKTTVVNHLLNNYNENELELMKSFTTRKLRDDEVEGMPYVHISQKDLLKKEAENNVIEKDCVFNYICGTLSEYVQEGKNYIKIATINGVNSFIEKYGRNNIKTIRIIAPLNTLNERLIERGETDCFIKNRIGDINKNTLEENNFKHGWDLTVNNSNGNIEKSISDIKNFIDFFY